MNPQLKGINEIYIEIEDYFFPASGYFDIERDGKEYMRKMQEYGPLHSLAKNKFLNVAPHLSPEEVIEGYEQGCRMLQANLSGVMVKHFDRKYIPVMLKAIKDDHGHTARLFLRALTLHASDLRDELIPLVISSLQSQHFATISAALSTASELRIAEALSFVQRMTKDSRLEVVEMAGNFLSDWEKTE